MDDNIKVEVEVPIGQDDIIMFTDLVEDCRDSFTWIFTANTGEDIHITFVKEDVDGD